MNATHLKSSVVITLAAALCCAGCAKHELVRQDQPLARVAPVAQAQSAAPAVPKAVAVAPKEDALAASKLKEAPAETQAAKGTSAEAGKEAALKALEKVFFDFDSYTLTPAARAALEKNAEILKKQAQLKVRIEGNCDELGSDDYNLALGENRAKSAYNYLKSLGIQPERLSVISYGKEKPADPGHDEAARAKNRRDEFVVSSK